MRLYTTSPTTMSPTDGTSRLVESAVSVYPVSIGITACPSSSISSPSRDSGMFGSSGICPGKRLAPEPVQHVRLELIGDAGDYRQVELPLCRLFEGPTMAELADVIS